MSSDETPLPLGVDTDDYATAAVEDTPTRSRGEQTESDFEAEKASYVAKFDNGDVRTTSPYMLRSIKSHITTTHHDRNAC